MESWFKKNKNAVICVGVVAAGVVAVKLYNNRENYDGGAGKGVNNVNMFCTAYTGDAASLNPCDPTPHDVMGSGWMLPSGCYSTPGECKANLPKTESYSHGASVGRLNKTNLSLKAQSIDSNPALIDGSNAKYAYNPFANPEYIAQPDAKMLQVYDVDLHLSERMSNANDSMVTDPTRTSTPYYIGRGAAVADLAHPGCDKSIRLQLVEAGDLKAKRALEAASIRKGYN